MFTPFSIHRPPTATMLCAPPGALPLMGATPGVPFGLPPSRDGLYRAGGGLSSKYQKVKELKKGGMAGAVWLIQSRGTGKLYVEKTVRMNSGLLKRARAELRTLKTVQGHANLNKLIEYEMMGTSQIRVVLEYCDRGSVQDRITQRLQSRQAFLEVEIWNIAAGVANALAFLHCGIVHMDQQMPRAQWDPICHLDLKPCNILYSSSGGENGLERIVLADFGCAVAYSDIVSGIEDAHLQACGTPVWYPPEGIPRAGWRTTYGPKTDMFMLGTSIQAICKLRYMPDRQALQTLAPCGSTYSRGLNSMVRCLTQHNFHMRPIPRQIVVSAKQRMRSMLGNSGRDVIKFPGQLMAPPLLAGAADRMLAGFTMKWPKSKTKKKKKKKRGWSSRW